MADRGFKSCHGVPRGWRYALQCSERASVKLACCPDVILDTFLGVER